MEGTRTVAAVEAHDFDVPFRLRFLGVGLPVLGAIAYMVAGLLRPADSATWFPYATEPPTALAFASFLLAVEIVGVACLVTRSWTVLRENLISLTIFCTLLLLALVVGRDELAVTGGGWPARGLALAAIPLVAGSLVLVVCALLIAQRTISGWPQRRPEPSTPLPNQLRVVVLGVAAVSALFALLLWMPWVDTALWWPWPLGHLDRMLLATCNAEITAAMITVARSSRAGQLVPQAALFFVACTGFLVACFSFPQHLTAGMQAPVFVLLVALGAALAVVLALRMHRLPR